MNVLVVGATSAIAEATARIWAARGDALYLVARRESLLSACAQDLLLRGAKTVAFERFDVLDLASHEGMLKRATDALGQIDCVLVAHGTLPDQLACDADPELAVHEIEVNGVSTAALLLRVAAQFEARREGIIAVVTSVAGVRGRSSNYVYGCAKSMVSTFLSGLRQRLHRAGVAAIDIRPGFVDTPMTQSFTKGRLWAKPAHVAKGIVNAVERRRTVVYLPWFWRWIMLVIRHIPESIFVRIRL